MKNGVILEGSTYNVYVNGTKVGSSGKEVYAVKKYAQFVGSTAKAVTVAAPAEAVVSKFHVNKRFEFLNKTVKMVAKGLQASAVISGAGGLGKSYSVRKALLEAGLRENTIDGENTRRSRTFTTVKGYSTAKGLYRTLFENNDSVIVFDDCDSVLKDPIALNLLKGALDSYDTRIISWNADMRDEDLPRSFIFTGRVVFISNMAEAKIDQAIRSRSAVIDVSMTLAEVVDRMGVMISEEEFLPEFSKSVKKEALAFIDKMKEKMREVSLRTLITVCKVRGADEDGTWEELAEYMTCK